MDLDKLSSVGFVRGSALTDLGQRLVVACYRPSDLTPAAIGARTWVSDFALGLYSRELNERTLVNLAEAIGLEAREMGLRVTPAMAPQLNQRSLGLQTVLPAFVVLVDKEPQRIIEHLDAIMPKRSGNRFPIIVFTGEVADELKRAFPEGRFVRADGDRGAVATEVVATVVQVLIAERTGWN